MVSVALVAAGALALPAAASATTFTVDRSFASGCDGAHNCGSIQSAVDAAGGGDSIDVHAGSYDENVSVPSGKDGLAISGSGRPTVNGAFKVASAGVSLASLLLQRNGGPDAPVLELAGGSAPPATLSKSVVVQQSSSNDTPAILVDGAGGATVIDSSAISATGPALRITRGSSQLIRSTLTATHDATNGLEIHSASDDGSSKALNIDSSIVSGGASAAGLKLASDSGIPSSSAGPISMSAVHLTTAGAATGIVLDAQANASGGSPAAGTISADVRSSIVHGANQTNQFGGDLLHTASSATLNLADTDTSTPDDQLFVNPGARDFHLRAGAPVIDTVAGPASGESDRDVDGDPRVTTGNAFGGRNLADKGADEFSNRPPAARLTSPVTTARERVGVPFDASGSTDPDAGTGGGVAAYAYSYGDGTTEASGSPHALHAYAVKGIYNATVSVLDAQGGLSSPSDPVAIAVTDGTAPVANILAPKSGAKIKARRGIPIAGQAADESGLQSVEVSVRYAGAPKRKHAKRATAAKHRRKKHKKKRKRTASTRTCTFVSPAAKLVKGSCTSLTYYTATLNDRNWTFPIKARNRLPRGTYEIRVRATDIAGNPSDAPNAAAGTLVTFRIV